MSVDNSPEQTPTPQPTREKSGHTYLIYNSESAQPSHVELIQSYITKGPALGHDQCNYNYKELLSLNST